MSYESQWQLTYDDPFVSRWRACLTQQAETYKDDTRADIAALAVAVFKQEPATIFPAWQSIMGAGPGFATDVDMGDGTIDSSKISDPAILAYVQNQWPVVAGMFFNADGTPKGGTP